MKKITAEYFKKRTGRDPIDDDLARCRCVIAGEFGHRFCGWCEKCDLPAFECECINPIISIPATKEEKEENEKSN